MIITIWQLINRLSLSLSLSLSFSLSLLQAIDTYHDSPCFLKLFLSDLKLSHQHPHLGKRKLLMRDKVQACLVNLTCLLHILQYIEKTVKKGVSQI